MSRLQACGARVEVSSLTAARGAGLDKCSVDTWEHPKQFRMGMCTWKTPALTPRPGLSIESSQGCRACCGSKPVLRRVEASVLTAARGAGAGKRSVDTWMPRQL